MHIEIQVALNFVISYLYNKLPRRRVNLFGEELERALKMKFDGHWYPEKPFKGSAYRCLRAGTPLDPVIETAARESGVDLTDIRENLPDELSIWIDPGEVSYRIGEKGSVKILYADDCPPMESPGSSPGNSSDEGGGSILDKEIGRSFNPEAQCFKPIESVSSTMANLSITTSPSSNSSTVSLNANNVTNNNSGGGCSPTFNTNSPASPNSLKFSSNNNAASLLVSPIINNNNNNNGVNNSSSNLNNANNNVSQPAAANSVPFIASKNVTPLTFTTATFAQTKFGSTKLKSSSKRSNRMSPTEFSNYIKQRAMLQQQQQQSTLSNSGIFVNGPSPSSPQPQRPRSLSPINLLSPAEQQQFVFMAGNGHHHQHHGQQQQHLNGLFDNSYLRDLIVVSNAPNAPSQQHQAHLGPQSLTKFSLNGDNAGVTQSNADNNAASTSASPFLMTGINDNSKSLLDGINFNLNTMPYSSQHLLVAN